MTEYRLKQIASGDPPHIWDIHIRGNPLAKWDYLTSKATKEAAVAHVQWHKDLRAQMQRDKEQQAKYDEEAIYL